MLYLAVVLVALLRPPPVAAQLCSGLPYDCNLLTVYGGGAVTLLGSSGGGISRDVWLNLVNGSSVKVPCSPDTTSTVVSAYWWTCNMTAPYLYTTSMIYSVVGPGNKVTDAVAATAAVDATATASFVSRRTRQVVNVTVGCNPGFLEAFRSELVARANISDEVLANVTCSSSSTRASGGSSGGSSSNGSSSPLQRRRDLLAATCPLLSSGSAAGNNNNSNTAVLDLVALLYLPTSTPAPTDAAAAAQPPPMPLGDSSSPTTAQLLDANNSSGSSGGPLAAANGSQALVLEYKQRILAALEEWAAESAAADAAASGNDTALTTAAAAAPPLFVCGPAIDDAVTVMTLVNVVRAVPLNAAGISALAIVCGSSSSTANATTAAASSPTALSGLSPTTALGGEGSEVACSVTTLSSLATEVAATSPPSPAQAATAAPSSLSLLPLVITGAVVGTVACVMCAAVAALFAVRRRRRREAEEEQKQLQQPAAGNQLVPSLQPDASGEGAEAVPAASEAAVGIAAAPTHQQDGSKPRPVGTRAWAKLSGMVTDKIRGKTIWPLLAGAGGGEGSVEGGSSMRGPDRARGERSSSTGELNEILTRELRCAVAAALAASDTGGTGSRSGRWLLAPPALQQRASEEALAAADGSPTGWDGGGPRTPQGGWRSGPLSPDGEVGGGAPAVPMGGSVGQQQPLPWMSRWQQLKQEAIKAYGGGQGDVSGVVSGVGGGGASSCSSRQRSQTWNGGVGSTPTAALLKASLLLRASPSPAAVAAASVVAVVPAAAAAATAAAAGSLRSPPPPMAAAAGPVGDDEDEDDARPVTARRGGITRLKAGLMAGLASGELAADRVSTSGAATTPTSPVTGAVAAAAAIDSSMRSSIGARPSERVFGGLRINRATTLPAHSHAHGHGHGAFSSPGGMPIPIPIPIPKSRNTVAVPADDWAFGGGSNGSAPQSPRGSITGSMGGRVTRVAPFHMLSVGDAVAVGGTATATLTHSGSQRRSVPVAWGEPPTAAGSPSASGAVASGADRVSGAASMPLHPARVSNSSSNSDDITVCAL
ncbi:hypothetical protein HXX76_012841 [Chlamydomonas incerta]|uniref:Uncharacterized protein n=1 Tax=Chlamydomonas incerta TaxID=51695 RepID=A0A835SVT4_CHLIN|nr:hypothetical protein HXX76_012841 [Chlamydomonas incerta]|eukprot:KAG2426786.1 hypothetical protein HXX76_012841 [Chlamydomonas incerta]